MQVTTATHKIASETEEANTVAAECQEALKAALPALAAAEEALNVLTKKDIAELKVLPKYGGQSRARQCMCLFVFLLSLPLCVCMCGGKPRGTGGARESEREGVEGGMRGLEFGGHVVRGTIACHF